MFCFFGIYEFIRFDFSVAVVRMTINKQIDPKPLSHSVFINSLTVIAIKEKGFECARVNHAMRYEAFNLQCFSKI